MSRTLRLYIPISYDAEMEGPTGRIMGWNNKEGRENIYQET